MRQHRVWSAVSADNYTTSKSFGGEFRQSINVGSSSRHSNFFASVEVRELSLPVDNWSLFALFVDGVTAKRAIFNNKSKAYQDIELDDVATDVIARIES